MIRDLKAQFEDTKGNPLGAVLYDDEEGSFVYAREYDFCDLFRIHGLVAYGVERAVLETLERLGVDVVHIIRKEPYPRTKRILVPEFFSLQQPQQMRGVDFLCVPLVKSQEWGDAYEIPREGVRVESRAYDWGTMYLIAPQ